MVTFLYRHFGADGSLLYVGISLSWPMRTKAHATGSQWFNQVTNVTVESFSTREEALQAEREAIKRENPKFNVIHNRGAAAKKIRETVKRTTAMSRDEQRDSTIERLVQSIKGQMALVGPALVYADPKLSVMVVSGTPGTTGELTELILGDLMGELPAWTACCDTVLTIRGPNDITLSEGRELRDRIIRALGRHIDEVQVYDTDIALTVAYASQFPSPKSRRILNEVAGSTRGVSRG